MPTANFQPTPHRDAVALIKGKPPISRDVFDRLLPDLRARAFTVTGIEAAHVLQRARDIIADMPEGKVWDEVKGDLVGELEPYLGEGAEKRAELLIRTHGFQAFNASNYQSAMEDEDTTHIQYLATEDDHVRDSHLALNGVVLPKYDPFWDTHTPPWEWGCRCRIRPMNPDLVDLERARDADRPPEERLVIEGPMRRALNEGTLIRGPRRFDVTPPSQRADGQNAFQWNPRTLNLSLTEILSHMEPAEQTDFIAYAHGQKLDDGRSLFARLTNPS